MTSTERDQLRADISRWIGRDYIDGTTRRLFEAALDEIERLGAESGDWKRRWQEAVDHASALVIERNHWQANHDHQVSRARFLIERQGIPIERVRAYEEMEALRVDAERYLKWVSYSGFTKSHTDATLDAIEINEHAATDKASSCS